MSVRTVAPDGTGSRFSGNLRGIFWKVIEGGMVRTGDVIALVNRA